MNDIKYSKINMYLLKFKPELLYIKLISIKTLMLPHRLSVLNFVGCII